METTTLTQPEPETTPPDPPGIGRLSAAVAGLLAAGAALATSALLSGISAKIPSLILSIADIFIDETPGGIVRWSIDTFGASQKTLLVTGIVAASLVAGALIGLVSRRSLNSGILAFVGFGVVGGIASARDPLASTGWAWFSAVVSAAVGIFVLVALIGAARSDVEVDDPAVAAGARRRFLGFAGGAAVFALGATGVGRRLTNQRAADFEATRQAAASSLEASAPAATATPSAETTAVEAAADGSFDNVDGLASLVTPNDDFYRIDTAVRFPQIDPADWTMSVKGMVDRPLTLSFDELLDLPMVTEPVTLSCVSNEVGGNLVGNAVWTGVPLTEILDLAGVQPGASQIVGRSVDDWTGGFPTEAAYDGRTALVAVQMNGEPLPVRSGFPARLVVAGLYGYVSATKWLKEIELTTLEDFDGYWIPRGWSKFGPIKTQSRIDVPDHEARIPAGRTPIAGVAWAPSRSVEKVEVRVDEGPWQEAELSVELSANTWRQWLVEWDATPGSHIIEVRATDGAGQTQTADRAPVAPDGATGWHTIRVEVQ